MCHIVLLRTTEYSANDTTGDREETDSMSPGYWLTNLFLLGVSVRFSCS